MTTAVKLATIAATALTLASCGTPVYSGRISENDYWLTATSPGGMYGGFFGMAPSETVLPKQGR